ncbi:MAG: hypothetical protein FWG56_04575, partial [Desulfovibrionaceae bacterium]|nr:hypothetical protein [Desulfovibrionaceae bacterium]
VELHMARADKMNALDAAMFDALIDAGTRLQGDESVRAVVLAGRGSLNARNTLGGTAPAQVRAQITRHRARLASF